MDVFGLGLVLDFKDNASAGMQGAMGTFTSMSAAADNLANTVDGSMMRASLAMMFMGNNLSNMGKGIISTITSSIKSVTTLGTEIQGSRIKLKTLFKSAEEGEKAFKWAQMYATKTPFNFQDLLPAMTLMKAVNIDVRDMVKTTDGHMQNLLDYAGDFATVFPDMRNMYGTGVRGAMGAIKEYISEGDMRSIRKGMGLDIEDILKEKKGSTMEERSRQVADLAQKIGAFGMTAEMAGTPTQRLSNMMDIWYNNMIKISDGGVFASYSKLVDKVYEYLTGLDASGKTESMANIISKAMQGIIDPLSKVLDLAMKFIDWIIELNERNPQLLGTIGKISLVLGSLLVLGGGMLSFMGNLGMLIFGMSHLGGLLPAVSKMFMALTWSIIPYALVFAALFIAWKKDIGGFRTWVTKEFDRIGTVLSAMFQIITGNSMSYSTFLKLKEMGLLPLIKSFWELKYIVEDFLKGMARGFEDAVNDIAWWMKQYQEKYDAFIAWLEKVGLKKKKLDKEITMKPDYKSWMDFGDGTAKILALILAAWSFLKILGFIRKAAIVCGPVFEALWWLIKSGAWLSTKAVGGLWTALKTIGTFATSPGFLAFMGTWGLVIAAIALTLLSFYLFADQFDLTWDGMGKHCVEVWDDIKLNFGYFIDDIKRAWQGLKDFLNTNIISLVIRAFLPAWLQPFVNKFLGNSDKPTAKGFNLGGVQNDGSETGKGWKGYNVKQEATGTDYWTGGLVQVSEKGGEIVNLPNGSQILPHDKSMDIANKEGQLSSYREMMSLMSNKTSTPAPVSTSEDHSFNFEKGSVVLQVNGTSDRDLEAVAEKFMQILKRKKELTDLRIRKPIFA